MSDIPDSLQRKLHACRTLPSVPAVALQVLMLCKDEQAEISQISKVLEGDPALCAEVLKFANSASYGLRCQVATLDRAVALLGINTTLSLALSFSFVRGLKKDEEVRFDHAAFWRRSAILAEATRTIGAWARAATRDELFLAGLLQDIGMLALNKAVPELYGPITAEAKGNHDILVEIEREKLGADHAAVGAWLLGKWNLPENLQAAVAGSHNPYIANSGRFEALVRSAALAASIAGIWSNPQTAEAVARARETSIVLFDIPENQFNRLLGEINAALPVSGSNLDINIGSDEALNLLLDQAREALVLLSLQTEHKAQEIQERSQTDLLTSLFNRAYLDQILPRYFSIAQKSAQPLSVLFVDIDHFKNVNDTYGHQAGDHVLVSVARALRSALRGPDIVGRYGGEEFLCLLPNTAQDGALLVGERLRAAIASHGCELASNHKIGVTISVGCATVSNDRLFRNIEELIDAADKCLYAAKRAGRNRVVNLDSMPLQEHVA